MMHRVALAGLLVCASALYLAFAWTDQLASLGGDSATYLLTAQHFAGIDPDLTAEFARRSFYPPLYPLLLALAGGATSLVAANVATTLFLLAAFAVLFAFARFGGIERWTALLIVTLFAGAPGSYLQTVMAQSENLYLLCSLGALAFATAYASSAARSTLAAAAACAALAALTRSAGIALLAAFFVRGIVTRDRALLLAALIAAIPAVAWRVLHPGEAGYATQLAVPMSDLAGFAASQVATWIKLWPSNFGVAPFAIALLWLVTLLGLIGAGVRALRWQIDGLYSSAYLAMCLLWPFPDEALRLLFVIMPVLLVQAVWLVQAFSTFVGRPSGRLIAPVVVGTVLITMLPGVALTIGRYRATPPDLERYRHLPEWYAGRFGPDDFHARDLLIQSMRDLPSRVAGNECVYAVKPTLTAFYARRSSRIPPPDLADRSCGYFLLMGATPTYASFYPLDQLHDQLEILALYSVPLENGQQRHVAALARWRPAQ